MEQLTRDMILTATDLPTETIEVPEWGGAVQVRGMTGTERDAYEAQFAQAKTSSDPAAMANFRARTCVRCIVSEDGTRLFSDRDADALGAKSAQALHRVFGVAIRLSGLGKAAVEAAEKNSASDQSADSGLSSP